MKNIGFYQSAFVKQTNNSNCGVTCICMILRYTGQLNAFRELRKDLDSYTDESSLLDLKHAAQKYGWTARCVQIDIATLRTLKQPCILHTINKQGKFHFQTLFAVNESGGAFFYIMGDPSYGIQVISEACLLKIWPSSAGLYIADLQLPATSNILYLWTTAIDWRAVPKAVWLCLPLAHVFSVILGISLSALFEQLINGSVNLHQGRYGLAVLFSLMIIIIMRSLFMHFKQLLLIKVNRVMNSRLTTRIAEDIMATPTGKPLLDESEMKNKIQEIGKIQLSVNGFVSVVMSDGLVLIILVSSLLYLCPIAALINVLYLILLLKCTISRLPGDLLSTRYIHTLHHAAENFLINTAANNSHWPENGQQQSFVQFYQYYLQHAAKAAKHFSKQNFHAEAAGAVNIVLVLGVLILFPRDQSTVHIVTVTAISYLFTLFLQRINGVLLVLYEGLQSARSLET